MTAIQVESDCQSFVKAMQSTEYDLAPEGVLHEDIRSFARLNFNSVESMYAPRGCNKLAHALAAVGSKRTDARQLWTVGVPDDVLVYLASSLAVRV